METFLPGISVVVPTFNRARYIPSLLTSLRLAADNFRGPSEVIVVDDSSPEEASLTRQLCEQNGARYLNGTASVRQKRNLGIQSAIHPIVLFVDSDCQVMPDLFYQHSSLYPDAEHDMAGVVGVTEFVGRSGWLWEAIQRTQFLNAFSFARRMEFAPWATCTNTSYRRDVLLEHGGFDVNFPFRLGGDDVDLGLRLNKAKYRIKCNARATVLHTRETWNSFPAIWRRAFRWGRMDVHLYYRKHRDRIGPGLPKFGHIFLLLALLSLSLVFHNASARLLLLPLVWWVSTLIIQALLTVRVNNEPAHYILHEIVADMLGLAFEFGALLEGIRCREVSVFYKTVRRGPVLPGFEQREWLIQHWSMWLGIIFTMLVQKVLL